MKKAPKFIFVVGGVISGVGKGTIASSLGYLLKLNGFSVAICKIDPYISMDAGNMRPTAHGEVFVSKDGGEMDMDLGNYERMLDFEITKNHNITTGKVYQNVINKERRMEYNGNHAEVIPDIPNEVERMIFEVVKENNNPDFLIVELGGTVGDLQNAIFEYALANMSKKYLAITILVTYIFYLSSVGEFKSKPTQHAILALRHAGLNPDFLIARGEKDIPDEFLQKISERDFVEKDHIVSLPDLRSSYDVPIKLFESKILKKILDNFSEVSKKDPKDKIFEYQKFLQSTFESKEIVRIGLVEKYGKMDSTQHKDVFVSVYHSLIFAGSKLGVKVIVEQVPAIDLTDENLNEKLGHLDGILVPGGFGASGVEGKILAIKYARERSIPFFGICYGMQMATIEFARNVCGMNGANTTEVNQNTKFPVVDILPEQIAKLREKNFGGTMRLGNYEAILSKGSLAEKLYGSEKIIERHRHRYELNPNFIEKLESKGLKVSGRSPDGILPEIIELPNHPFFIGVQFHPEFKSRPLIPHPIFLGFIEASRKKGKNF